MADIAETDLRIDVLRHSLGPDWAASIHDKKLVRITHLPTGIVVESDSERSQLENKAKCLRELHARLDGPTPSSVMAELRLREWLNHSNDSSTGFMDDIRAVLTELDRQRGLIEVVLTECERREDEDVNRPMPNGYALMDTDEIRSLLSGEELE